MTESQSDSRKRVGESSPNAIVKKVWIRASSETVYSALTEPKELTLWFCDRASCEVREGGELVAFWKSGKENQQGRAVFTRVVPGIRLELRWTDEGRGPEQAGFHHTLEYEIRSKSGMTELIMVDKDEACSDDDTNAFVAQGWNSVLLELKDHCERKERSGRLKPRLESQRGTSTE